MSERRALGARGVDRSSVRYRSRRACDAAVRLCIVRGLAAQRRRFGYRRLHLLLTREGHHMNQKRFRRLYLGRRSCRCAGVAAANGRWACGRRSNCQVVPTSAGRWISCPTASPTAGASASSAVVNDFTRESLALIPDTSLSGDRVARELGRVDCEARSAKKLRFRQRYGADQHGRS